MRIGFVGAGKVGFTFGRYIGQKTGTAAHAAGILSEISVGGYLSTHRESAELAARFTDTCVYDSLEELAAENDMIFLTVPDGQIPEVWKELRQLDIRGRLICHASGALTSAVFSGKAEAGAFGYSIHPMYAISSKYESYKELDKAFFTVEGDMKHKGVIKDAICAMGNECVVIDGSDKVKYHSAAVCASNLVTGLLDVAERLLLECGFDEEQAGKALLPLFLGNAENAAKQGTAQSLTGPVERCDVTTVKRHMEVLDGDVLAAYTAVSKCLVDVASRKHPDRDYTELRDVLNGIGE